MSKIVEEVGIPIPASIPKGPRNEYVAALESTKVGNSFSIYLEEGENMQTTQSKIRQAAKRRGINIVANQVSKEQLRVWVVAGEKKEGEA